jgi:hypothetical protein
MRGLPWAIWSSSYRGSSFPRASGGTGLLATVSQKTRFRKRDPQPYVRRGKNDRNDAEATCEAAGRPGMHFACAMSY